MYSTTSKWADVIDRAQGHVLYAGRPDWLADTTVAQLVEEVRASRSEATRINDQGQRGAPAGPAAIALAESAEVVQFVQGLAGSVSPSGDANYLYYEQAGAGIEPHIDRAEFAAQILIMIEHYGYGESRSQLAVFPDGPRRPVFVPLDPGELVLFRASEVVHGRTPVVSGEVARLLGIGFLKTE
jgi:hypothetical protein